MANPTRTMGKGWKVALTDNEREIMDDCCSDPSGCRRDLLSDLPVVEELARRGLVDFYEENDDDWDYLSVNLSVRGWDANDLPIGLDEKNDKYYWAVETIGWKYPVKYGTCYEACREAELKARALGATCWASFCGYEDGPKMRGEGVFYFEPPKTP